MGKFVQYGCGLSAPASWDNYDASPTLRLQKLPLVGSLVGGPPFPKSVRYGDIRNGLSLPTNSVEAVYCSHTLEHLSLEDFRTALRETHRILRQGGVFRFVLPDLRRIATKYVQSTSPQACIAFMEESLLGRKQRPKGFQGLLRSWLGNSEHLWMWDFESMQPELTQAGFVNVRRATFSDSSIAQFKDVEDPDRWNGELGVECQKPTANA